MDIANIKTRKAEFERQIAEAVGAFEAETGCTVSSVHIRGAEYSKNFNEKRAVATITVPDAVPAVAEAATA